MSERRDLHKDWRTWAVVLMMLGAMGMYVLTLDDSTVDPAAPEASQGDVP